MARLTCIALVLLATCASGAAAAAPWSPPENLSSPSLFVTNPDVVFAANGTALATWGWLGPEGGGPGGSRLAVRAPGAAEFGPGLTAPSLTTPLLPYSRNRLLGLDLRPRGGGENRFSLRSRLGRSDGTFSRPDTISTFTLPAGTPSLAVHEDALAAWIAEASGKRRIVRAAIRVPGHRFGRPITLRARGRANDVVAGAGPGLMFVAWERAGVVEARVRLAGRSSWGPVQRIGRANKASTTFRVAFSGKRAYLVWLGESAESGVLQAAVFLAGGSRFHSAQTVATIERDPPEEPHGPAIVAIPERDALLAWTDWDGANWRVRTAVSGAGGRFGTPVDVSPAGQQSVLGDAASIPPGNPLPAGTVMLVWSRLDAVDELGNHVLASLRPPGGSFGTPEEVSDLDRARLPAVAFENTSRRWTTVWSQRIGPDGPGIPQTQVTTFARSSTRPG